MAAELEAIGNRLGARHDEYAVPGPDLDDSLGLLGHVADIYRRFDDVNPRLCNQAFFTAISIGEDARLRSPTGARSTLRAIRRCRATP